MKKQLLAALTTSLIVSSLGTAFAAEDSSQDIKIDGSFSFYYRDQHDKNNIDTTKPDTLRTAFKSTLTLNVDAPLAKNFDAYATLNYQAIDSNYGNFSADYFDSSKQSNAGLTAIGLKYKNADYSYVVGSQALTLGGGLAYDNGYIGKYALPYALNISKKVGATNLNVIAAKTNYQSGIDNDTFYTIQSNYDVNPKTNVGAMYTHVSYGNSTISAYNNVLNSSMNLYSLYASHKLSDKLTASSEYIQSDASINNKGVQANFSYKADDKNTFGTGYYHVEDQASIYDYNGGGMTTSPNNNTKGYVVSWKHNFDKNISLKIADVNYHLISSDSATTSHNTNTDRNRLYSSVTVAF